MVMIISLTCIGIVLTASLSSFTSSDALTLSATCIWISDILKAGLNLGDGMKESG